MLNKLKEFLEKIKDSNQFKEWNTSHKNSYFCSAFLIGADIDQHNWQIDFYNPENDKITSFIEVGGLITLKEEDVFKKPDDKVKELDLEKVKIDLEKALDKFERLKKKKYHSESPTQKIIILQNMDFIIWNITYINTSFNILNIKINAVNGKVIDDSLTSVMSFKDKKFDTAALSKFKKN